MSLQIQRATLSQIHAHGEHSYPEEGAGFLLGSAGDTAIVQDLMIIANRREAGARHNRYRIDPDQYLQAELEAERRNLDLLGVFHSHPDHPNLPSEYDREWAQPVFSYVITNVEHGKAVESRSWRLNDDRTAFAEEDIAVID